MPSTHKKVIVRKMGRDSLSGYVSPARFVVEGKLELLNPSGKVVLIDLGEVKSVDFVRDFLEPHESPITAVPPNLAPALTPAAQRGIFPNA